MRRAEITVAACCVVLGVCVVWQARGMEYMSSLGPGPGFFPLWLGLILTGLSGVWLLSAVRSANPDASRRFFPEWHGLRRIVLIAGAIVGVGAAMEFIGFRLAMFAFAAFVLTALGRRGWGLTIIVSSVLSFGVYHTFTRWLDVSLPQASIEILSRWGF